MVYIWTIFAILNAYNFLYISLTQVTAQPESVSLHSKHGSSADKAWLSFIYQLPKIFFFQLLLLQDSIVEIAESHRQLIPMDILIRDVKHFAIYARDAEAFTNHLINWMDKSWWVVNAIFFFFLFFCD